MADRKILVRGDEFVQDCEASEDGVIFGIVVAAPVSAGLGETITTEEQATLGSQKKQPGYRRWIANLWDGAVSVAAGVFDEMVTVNAQAGGVPVNYKREIKDAAGNVIFTIARTNALTAFEYYDPIGGATTEFYPEATYAGQIGMWLVQKMNKAMGIYNRGWLTGSGVPAIILRAFDNATADDVLVDAQDNDGSPQYRVFGDGATENGAFLGSGGGLIERTVRASYADAATHALWTSEDLGVTGLMAVEAHVIALKSDGTVYGKWVLKATFRRPAAGATTQEGITDTTGSDPANPITWGADFAASGNAVVLNVYGELTTVFKANIRRMKIIPV